LLGLSLTAWLATLLPFLLFVLVFRVFALRNNQAAVSSTGAVQRHTQLWNRNRRHQGAGEQDIAKLLQLPDRFELQVALLRIVIGASVRCAAAAPIAARLVPHCGRTLVAGSMVSNEQFFRLAICPD